jgi:hypothetical protein
MKTVSNRKTRNKDGVTYRMSRVFNGQRFSINIMVPEEEICLRRLVAFRLLHAREQLQMAVEQHRSSFT